ncbi:GNAT family N-acetyltransferase [Aliivibrio logei]|uniref:N-acetyltransferase domain-containing protein n=1 Tax=Aliivibrio logei 5S-186 TaxID=626086 RepID=A0ABX3ASH5_ALILO|nr:GNAT family N-acetyltransferase [Aliivibrio logei]OEF10833.1 hypothetical protein A1Q5_01510 [Aliivibrio logei 5S-186]
MKTIADIKRILAKGNLTTVANKQLSSGIISDEQGNDCQFKIIHGWDSTIAALCDSSWGKFNMRILDYIYQAPISDKEKETLLETSQFEDHHWSWEKKHQCLYSEQYDWFFYTIDDIPQAACVVYHPKQSIKSNKNIFYIEFLAVAPWNRPNHIESQKFKGIGSSLLKNVIEYAKNQLGLIDGFSLHALPKAEGYYNKIGMIRFTQYDKGPLGYFEMPEQEQLSFLEAQ